MPGRENDIGSDDGDRQMVKVLSAVLTDGLAAVEAACAEALADGVHSADVVLNILSRHRDPGARRFDQAVPKLVLAIQEDPSFPMPYRSLAACYAHMGRLDNAREIIERLRAITSVVIPDLNYMRKPEQRELYLSGLRLAADEAT